MSAVALVCLSVAAFLLCLDAAYADPPTTTPEDMSAWQTSAFTITLGCAAGSTSGDELSSTWYKMDWESAYSEKVWPNGVSGGTLRVTYLTLSLSHAYDGIHQFSYYSVGHNDVSDAYEQEAPKSLTVKMDTTSPTVVVGPAPADWVGSGRTLDFTATDGGSGLQSFTLKVDGDSHSWTYGEGTASGAATWPVSAPADHSNDGLHTYEYWATDWVGRESLHDYGLGSLSFGIDTRKPSTQAPSSATGRRGRTATLKYQVLDPVPNGGTASVTIKVKNRANKVVKTLPLGVRNVNTRLTAKFKCTLARGSYTFYVYAKDAAGNQQVSPAHNKLTVR